MGSGVLVIMAGYFMYGAATEGGFILCSINIFILFISDANSFNLLSAASFCPCIALGIKSLRPLTSSPVRRDSSSLVRLADFNSLITVSTSVKATSNRSVRSCSEVLSVSVSFAN